ncbi:MAG: GNAT family N-acetyltransferase [Gloeomargaritaceae cyanobacterium C42_A2020_066]|nr:GNAT family N-acetyltransferase [Gloeomargaritaceae cyanobacterium C42_A2020_066]
MFQVTDAQLEDVPQLVALLTLLFCQEADFRPDEAAQAAGLRLILECPEAGRILVLRQGAQVVGMVNLLFTISTARGGRVAPLEDLIVAPEYRGQGAGSALLRGAITLAQDCGCSRITLLTDEANAAAQRFYQRHGFSRSGMVPFRRLLDSVPPRPAAALD